MGKDSKNYRKKKLQINRIEKTSERLTGRAGLSLFIAYMHGIGIFPNSGPIFRIDSQNQKGRCRLRTF